jgi:hypothetical protein
MQQHLGSHVPQHAVHDAQGRGHLICCEALQVQPPAHICRAGPSCSRARQATRHAGCRAARARGIGQRRPRCCCACCCRLLLASSVQRASACRTLLFGRLDGGRVCCKPHALAYVAQQLLQLHRPQRRLHGSAWQQHSMRERPLPACHRLAALLCRRRAGLLLLLLLLLLLAAAAVAAACCCCLLDLWWVRLLEE